MDMKKPVAEKLRRKYTNTMHPLVIMRFEDGHEIKIYKGEGKTFDAWRGETIKVVAVYDPTASERDVVEVRKAEQFDEA